MSSLYGIYKFITVYKNYLEVYTNYCPQCKVMDCPFEFNGKCQFNALLCFSPLETEYRALQSYICTLSLCHIEAKLEYNLKQLALFL